MAIDFDPSTAPPSPSPAASDIAAPAQAPIAPAPAPQPATPAATPASATPSTPAPPEDRSNWVPPYRLREAREAAVRQAQAEANQRFAAQQAELERYRTQLQALVGAQPRQNPEVDAVRDQFGKLYPGLSKVEERAQQLLELLDRAGDLESQNLHYWQSYGRQAMDKLFNKASETLGSPLSDEGKRALHAAFTGFVQSSPELEARYANDPTFVDEFWGTFQSIFVDPARRAATASTVSRVPQNLPQDTPGGVPATSPAPRMNGIDERASAAWSLYNQTRR